MVKRIKVADLYLNPVTKSQLLEEITQRIKSGQKTFLTTLYSEFIYHSLSNKAVSKMLNRADIAIADGVGVIWAQYFLSRDYITHSIIPKIIESWWQVIYTGASILLAPKNLYKVFPEKIVGADLIWDLAQIAEQNNFSVYLLGGYGQVPEQVEKILAQHYPNINIVGASNKNPNDDSILDDIKQVNPDMLLVAFGRITQEQWITSNWDELPVKFAVGLGGSFDYVVGHRKQPPRWVRDIGLEWLYRLFTQPHRFIRILEAVWGLIIRLMRYKIFESFDYRNNVAVVVVNKNSQIWLGKRGDSHPGHGSMISQDQDYWQFPQGGVDKAEDIVLAARRELHEETNISSVELLGVAKYIHSYTWLNGVRSVRWSIRKSFQYKGQEQFTVLFKFTGNNDEIVVDGREFVDYQWVSLEDVPQKIAPIKKMHAEKVLGELKQILEKSA